MEPSLRCAHDGAGEALVLTLALTLRLALSLRLSLSLVLSLSLTLVLTLRLCVAGAASCSSVTCSPPAPCCLCRPGRRDAKHF